MGVSDHKVTSKHCKKGLSLRIFHNPNGPLIHIKSSHFKQSIGLSDVACIQDSYALVQRTPSYTLAQCRGSLSLEAAIVLPILVIAVFQMLSYFGILQQYVEKNMYLYQSSCIVSACAYVMEQDRLEEQEENAGNGSSLHKMTTECTDMVDIYSVENLYPMFGKDFYLVARGRTRKWTGYDNTDEKEQIVHVYVTDNREVYHTSLHCTHLELSIERVKAEDLSRSHNAYGEGYEPCSFCIRDEPQEEYYITETGDHYHGDLVCAGLVRRIRMVPMEEVQGLPICSRCSKREEQQ